MGPGTEFPWMYLLCVGAFTFILILEKIVFGSVGHGHGGVDEDDHGGGHSDGHQKVDHESPSPHGDLGHRSGHGNHGIHVQPHRDGKPGA